MDVGGWLRGLGLGQYEEEFRDNKIDADLLPRLTVDDLKDIGVSVVGDRRRLLDAIALIASAGSASPTKSASFKGLEASAERRPITVMFCDLVGSTSIAAKLDAEDWRNLVNAYLDEASTAVTGLGGHVLKKLGDGLMALFGYPQAQENDAERAVRAALAIQRALAELNARHVAKGAPELSARVGIESGPVVVEASGEVFGDAPNVAARVQAQAKPGSVLITLNVQRQVAGLFVVEEQSSRELKGVSRPVQLFRIVRASGGGRRGGARTLTPFVGREEELGLLTRRWERARAGEGQLVLVVGEPGLGKSRLIEEFHVGLAETPHTWVEWSASQLLQNTPLHPIAEWGRLRFGADAPAEQRLADLEGTLRLIGLDPAEHAPLLAPLVDIPLPPARAANFPPEELRRRQLAAMTAWVLAGARSQPVVLAFEDLHWADPTSLDLLRAFADRGAQVPMLLLATTRPEFRPDWSLRSHHSVISLSPLDRAGVARMVSEISARHALSREVIEGVSERTGGVPLFVEEVTRLLVERGEQGGVQAIPPTLQQSLAARLDRLGPAREVAQIGAVLGRDFTYLLLRDVAQADEPTLQASLDRLADVDLLFVEGSPPQANYRFKHALIQDAAYDSLLKSRRRALHRRAADALREANAEPEAIAHHFTEAGLDDLAIEWWGKAGDQALRRSAFQEAIAHLGKAIAMADNAGETPLRAPGSMAALSHRLPQLHAAYGNALIAARGHGARETIEAFARARKSASGDEDAPGRLAADYGLWVGSYVRGDLPSMRTHAAAFLAAVAMMPDTPEAGVAHRVVGTTHCFAGEYAEARDHLERALTLFQPGRDDDLAFRFGQDVGVAAMCYLAIASWPLGNVRRAVSLFDGAHERLASVAHIGTHPYAKLHAAAFDLMRGDRARAAENGSEAARLAREHDLPLWRAYGSFFEGFAAAERGALGEGLSDMRRGVESLRQQDLLNFDGLLKIALAEAEARAGDRDRAVAVLDEALATADHLGYGAFEAELHRARGEILLKRDPANPAPAEEAFLTAIAIAKHQGARSFELRAAFALAKLYQSTGRHADAHAVLAPALEGFTPPEMPEIVEAQALLAALAETEEVKAAVTQRRRRLGLQTAYSQAVLWSKGWAASETKTAFERISDLALGAERPGERFPTLYGRSLWSLLRGDVRAGRETAEEFLQEAEAEGRPANTGVAHRVLGLACTFQGDLAEARKHLELALEGYVRERDGEVREKFGQDTGVAARIFLAHVLWLSGDLQRSRQLIEEATRLGNELGHLPSTLNTLGYKTFIESIRNDPESVAADAETLFRVSREHGAGAFMALSGVLLTWAQGRLNNSRRGADDLRKSLAEFAGQGNRAFIPVFHGFLAELETAAGETERALAAIDEGFTTARDGGQHFADAFLHRLRGDILLKGSPADPRPAEEAYRTAIAIAKEQGALSYELLASLALAKLCQSTSRLAEAHAVLAPALEGFSPTPEMPEIAEAQALLAALAATDEVKAQVTQRERLAQLQVAYGNALIAARGYGAPETTEAFARARESASGDKDAPERLAADFGLWAGSFTRGELPTMRAHAAAFLSDVEARPDSSEASVAHRAAGMTSWFAGEYREARDHVERALALFQPGRDDYLAFRFGQDAGIGAMAWLAIASWPLGDVERAISLIDRMQTRIAGLTHVGTLALGRMCAALFELMRGDHTRAAPNALELVRLAREHDLPMWRATGVFLQGWATAASGAPGGGLEDMRRGVDLMREVNYVLFDGLLKIALAEAEARAGDPDRAVAILDEALATCDRLGHRAFEAELHRARGDALLLRDPANSAPAEEAFLTAIAIAKQQTTRSFELRAALSLANLYKMTGRPVEAHTVLASALEGFSQTPEMPELTEAQALLAALAEMDEVKSAEGQRQRRLHLQTAYGQALMWSKGFAAEETKAAFERAAELAAKSDDFSERFAAAHGQWTMAHVRGELRSARELTSAFLREAEEAGRVTEAGVARRGLALISYLHGDFVEARTHCERALAISDPEHEEEARERYGEYTGTVATACLAVTTWHLGEIERARELIEIANRRATELGHPPSIAGQLFQRCKLEILRGDAAAALSAAEALEALSREHGLALFRLWAELFTAWARGRLHDPAAAAAELRQALATLTDQGQMLAAPIFYALLAELEAETFGAERALARIDEALALAHQLGQRAELAFFHRLRGEILLKRDPANAEPAEDAFKTAIAVAKDQRARSLGLQAALSLAKLYQSTARPADAQVVLTPALEGFAPTDEMPEIAQAQTLLVAIEAGAHVRNE